MYNISFRWILIFTNLRQKEKIASGLLSQKVGLLSQSGFCGSERGF